MSTHSRHPTESTLESTSTDPETTPAADSAPPSTPDAARDAPDADESWVARCQSQFDAERTDALRNLADDANHAMPGGV